MMLVLMYLLRTVLVLCSSQTIQTNPFLGQVQTGTEHDRLKTAKNQQIKLIDDVQKFRASFVAVDLHVNC